MPQGSKEEITEPNTDSLNIRVPKTLKVNMSVVMEYKAYSSYGEFLRDVAREDIESTMNSSAFKAWQKRREEEGRMTKEEVDVRAKALGYELTRIERR